MGYLTKLEQPRASVSADELDRWVRMYGSQTKSGVAVSADVAMGYSAVFACVRVVSEDVAKLPLILYKRNPDGSRERATDHPAYRLMHDRPNSFQTSFEFREMMQGHVELRGNAFAFKNVVRNVVRELLPIHPKRVTVRTDSNFNIWYEIRGFDTELTDKEILHIRGMSSDGFTGMSPLALHRETIGMGIAMREHGAMLFGNGAQPGGILELPGRLKIEAQTRIKDSVAENYGGENRFKTMVLEDGAKWHQVGMTSEDAQYLESRKFNRTEIAAIHRVPPHKIGDLSDANYSNVVAQNTAYVQDALDARLARWTGRLNESLLSPTERQTHYFEFLTEGLLRGLTKERYDAYHLALTDGWMSRNEVRRRENMDPKEGLDEYLRQANMAPVAGPVEKTPA